MRKNKKIIWLVVAFLAVCTALFSLAGKDSESTGREVGLYFLSSDGSALVQETKVINARNNAELYKKIAETLIGAPPDKKYAPLTDKNVKVLSVKNDNGSLTVDFSAEYKSASLVSTYAVIKTFASLSEVREARVTAGGAEILKSDGEPLGFVSADKINTVSDDDCATGIRLYFANEEKDALVMEYRKINITDTQPTEQYIVTELIKGPKGKEHERLLEADTGIISVETTDGICYVNFKQNFIDKNIASNDKSKLIIYSIVNSLTEREHIESVQFLIEGKKTDKFGDISIADLFVRNEDLIEN